MIRNALAIICGVAFCVCAAGFASATLAPQQVERQVRAVVVARLRQELAARFGPKLGDAQLVERLRSRLKERIGILRAEVEGPLPDRVAAWLDTLCRYDCGLRTKLADRLRGELRLRAQRLERVVANIEDWARGRYAGLVDAFVREAQVFTAANACSFLLALIAILRFPSNRTAQTLAVMLVMSTAGAAYCYFAAEELWLRFLLADYLGWAYLVWIGVIFVVLLDIGVNQARAARAMLAALG